MDGSREQASEHAMPPVLLVELLCVSFWWFCGFGVFLESFCGRFLRFWFGVFLCLCGNYDTVEVLGQFVGV